MYKRSKRDLDYSNQRKLNRILFCPIIAELHAVKFRRVSSAHCLTTISFIEGIDTPPWKDMFPDLMALDHITILSYKTSELVKECGKAVEFFSNLIDELNSNGKQITSAFLTEELLRVYIVCLKHYFEFGSSSIKDCQQFKSFNTLAQLLLVWLKDTDSKITLLEFHHTILKIISESLNSIHENINKLGKVKDIAFCLYCQYQILIGLIALTEYKEKYHAEFIKNCYKLIESSIENSLRNQSFNEIYEYQLGKKEHWVRTRCKYKVMASTYGRKKFSLIKMKAEAKDTYFSLRYMCLYYIAKLAKLKAVKRLTSMNEQVIVHLRQLLEYECGKLTPALNYKAFRQASRTETYLNEVSIVLKILKVVLANLNDPFNLLVENNYNELLKSTIDICIKLSFKHEYINTFQTNKAIDISDTIPSYRIGYDYLSGVFLFVSKLRELKEPISYGRYTSASLKNCKTIIMAAIEELIGKYINDVDTMTKSEVALRLFKLYVVDYLLGNRKNISRQIAECVIQLIESKSIHFTAPIEMDKLKDDNSIARVFYKKIIILLKAVIESDKVWAETILIHLIGLIAKHEHNEGPIFGLYKLLFCMLTGEVHDNVSFYNTLFKDEGCVLNYSTYVKQLQLMEFKAIKAFIDIKGIDALLKLLLNQLYVNKEANGNIISMTERIIVKLLNIPATAEYLLNQSVFSMTLNNFPKLKSAQDIKILIIGKLLNATKYSQREVSSYKNDYLPLQLLESIANNIKYDKLEDCFPLMNLTLAFFHYERDSPSIAAHQEMVIKNFSIEKFVLQSETISDIKFIKEFVKFVLKLIRGLRAKNDNMMLMMSNTESLGKNMLELIKGEITKGIFDYSEIREILRLILEVIFEVDIDFNISQKLLIIHPDFLVMYLSILLHLSSNGSKDELIYEYCRNLYKRIKGSYWNNSICKNENVFKKLIRLLQRYRKNKVLSDLLLNMCKDIILNVCSIQCLKNFLRLLNTYPEPITDYEDLCNNLMSFIVTLLNAKPICEVFVFSGRAELGIGLITKKELPMTGFCFCGSIRLERFNQANKDDASRKMTIFKLGSSKTKEVEFFVVDGMLNYRIANTSSSDNEYAIRFSKKLECDRWYFIELYHLAKTSANNLRLYIDSVLSQNDIFAVYPPKMTYDENSIGCGVQLEYVGKQGEEEIINNFCGEMSALYFFEVTDSTIEEIHSFLSRVEKNSRLDCLIEYSNSTIESKGEESMIKKIFMHVNPKYINTRIQYKQKIYSIKTNEGNIDLYNDIERIYSKVKFDHIKTAKELYINLGGVKILFPVLNALIEHKAKPQQVYIIYNM